MWIENKIPLVDFYEACKQNLKKADYRLLLCLVARSADAPGIFEEVRQHWSSFHDVTGKSILFMFAGNKVDQVDHKSHILFEYYGKKEQVFRSGPKTEIIYSDSAIVAGDFTTRIGQINPWLTKQITEGYPRIKTDQKFEESHSLEISELAKHLRLGESDIPCLNITFLPYQLSVNIPLDISVKFYPFIKFIGSLFYKSELSTASQYDLNAPKQLAQKITQQKENIRKQIGELLSGKDNGFKENFLQWANRLNNREEIKKNEIFQNAVRVIAEYMHLPEKEVIAQVYLLKQALPDSNRFQRMLKFTERYLIKFYNRPEVDYKPKLRELEKTLQQLEQTPLNDIYLESFRKFIDEIKSWGPVVSNKEEAKIQKLRRSLEVGNVQTFINILKSIFAGFSYNMKLSEGFFHGYIQLILDLSGININSEKETNIGRIDAVVNTEKFVYIMEFKLDDAEAAIQQIKNRKYYEAYLSSGKEIILLGIGFNTDEKNIGSHIIERIGPSA